MSVPTWPSSLPSFPIKEWDYTRKTSMLTSEMEIGPPKRRKRTTASYSIVSGSLLLSSAQFALFREFTEVTLSGGIGRFLWPDFITGNLLEVVLSIDTNGDLYKVSQTDEQTFKVQIKLEVLP